jgi:hypothetical protein
LGDFSDKIKKKDFLNRAKTSEDRSQKSEVGGFLLKEAQEPQKGLQTKKGKSRSEIQKKPVYPFGETGFVKF